MLEHHLVVIVTAVAVQLPDHCLQPLLVVSEILELRVTVAVEGGDNLCKLLVQVVQVSRGPVAAVLTPHAEERIIKWAEQVGKMKEASELMRHVVRRVIAYRWWVD